MSEDGKKFQERYSMEDEKKFYERLLKEYREHGNLDRIIYTPEELKRRQARMAEEELERERAKNLWTSVALVAVGVLVVVLVALFAPV